MRAVPLPLPRGWTKTVRSAIVQAIAVASTALTAAWGRAATAGSTKKRLLARLDRAEAEIALLLEQLDIKDHRWNRLSPRRRPHYGPIQRMRILQLKAARGWSREQAAERFLVTEETIASWTRRVDEEGGRALVQIAEPVNRFPDFVACLVRWLKVHCPRLGTVRIAQMLARAGLHLGATTVKRMLKRELSEADVDAVACVEEEPAKRSVVTAKYPNHVWHGDLTTIPTRFGLWGPWLPFSLIQRWPFCWWLAVAIDHTSRLVVGFALFPERPASSDVCRFLGKAISRADGKPKYIIADKGNQFWCSRFKRWCRRRHITPRFGAVGKHGSIAVIERFIRSMKDEGTCRLMMPLSIDSARTEIASYVTWYDQHRPHRSLGGKTPWEVCRGTPPANEAPRFEPRGKWPLSSPCAGPAARISGRRGVKLEMVLRFVDDKKHLPIVELKRAA